MSAITHITISWWIVTGRIAVAALGAGLALFASYLVYVATGLLQFRHVQIITFEPYDPTRWSIHFLGAAVEDSDPLFRLFCLLLLLPSLVVGAWAWHHFGRRWKAHHES